MMDQSMPTTGANQLRKNSLGVSAIIFLVVWAALPLAFVLVTAILLLFVGANGAMAIVLPGLVVIAAGIGFLCARQLKDRDPAAFARLGAGQEI